MAKETLIIGKCVRSFNYLRRQGFCKKAKETLIIGLSVPFLASPQGRGGTARRDGVGFANAQAFAGVAEAGVGYANADAFAYLPKGETLQAKTF